MHTFTESAPLPMRFPVADEFIDIGVWPGGWRFLSQDDAGRFDALADADRDELRRAFDAQSENL